MAVSIEPTEIASMAADLLEEFREDRANGFGGKTTIGNTVLIAMDGVVLELVVKEGDDYNYMNDADDLPLQEYDDE
ncbi:hypothetical protein [Vibrio phage VCPH]|nr:hypothetical protein [Vibrio phage VCPH]